MKDDHAPSLMNNKRSVKGGQGGETLQSLVLPFVS
jgi:hypothetical protein